MADPAGAVTGPPTDEPIALGWYAVALVVYVVLGLAWKTWFLNWIIGPLFLLIVLYLVPTAVRRVVRPSQARPAP